MDSGKVQSAALHRVEQLPRQPRGEARDDQNQKHGKQTGDGREDAQPDLRNLLHQKPAERLTPGSRVTETD